MAKEELESVGRVTVRGTGHRTVTSPYNNTLSIVMIMIVSPFIDFQNLLAGQETFTLYALHE